MNPIKHIWFDFSETIALLNHDIHNALRYETYAQIVGRPVTVELKAEYDDLYKKSGDSNAAIFRSLGQTPNFWSERMNSLKPNEIYRLAEPDLLETLHKIKAMVPISLFSNIEVKEILQAFNINPGIFENIISAGMVKEPKPALDGFHKMLELTPLPPIQILYIGDSIPKDIRPAKQAGLQTGLIWGQSDEADYNFANFAEILAMLSEAK